MPEKATIEKAKHDKRQGKSASSQAGEFVREEMHHIRQGKHGARSTKQAIAIGLSKARRAGVKLPPPKKGTQSKEVRKKARLDIKKGRTSGSKVKYPKVSRARMKVLRRERGTAASHRSISRQATRASRERGPTARHASAMKAVQTKGREGLRRAARKAALTRQRS